MIRNRLMSIASILTVASCIFIVSVFYCLAANVELLLSQLENSVSITIFVHEDLTGDEVSKLYSKLLAIPKVAAVQYKTANDRWEWFADLFNDPDALEGMENPLRRSFDIEIEELTYHEDVVQALERLRDDGVDTIKQSRDFARNVKVVSDGVRMVCIVLILILGIISIVIIFNTIRITVNARKNEINIMKYVGATDWFIRWPFVIEGVLIGVAGGIVPAVACWLCYDSVIGMIRDSLPAIDFVAFRPGYDIFAYLFPFDLAMGMVIGIIGSIFSVRRHLKV